MNRLDKLIRESVNNSLKSFLREDSVQGTFEQCLGMFDNQMSKYIQEQEILLNNKKSYYETVKDIIISCHQRIMSLGFDYSLVKSEFLHSSFIEIKYFINGSLNWDDDTLYDNEDKLYDMFSDDNLSDLDIEIDMYDRRDKGGECFIVLRFDMDNIFTFDIAEK